MLLDQQTYDRLNTMEATIARLVEAVEFLERTAFPLREVTIQGAEEFDSESEGTVEKNETPKKKPKAKKKTVRKTS